MKVEIPDLTGAECGDIAITAAEGGIGYWSQIESYDYRRWAPGVDDIAQDNIEVADDFVFYTLRADLTDDSTYAGVPIDITPALLRRGLDAMLAAPQDRGGWGGRKIIDAMLENRDEFTGEIDSDLADMLVQFGCFGELVFG